MLKPDNDGTCERPLGNGKSVYLYPILYGMRIALGDTGTCDIFDNLW